ncbi:MAG: ABC transporter ATP-binding protein [Caldilineaceae bacterium]
MNHYRTLLSTYLKPLWQLSVFLLLLLLANAGLQLLNPQIMARFIDGVLGGSAFSELLQLALAFLVLTFVGQAITVAESYVAANIGLQATNRLRADLAMHCLQLDLSFHNQRTPGELIERIDGDVGQLNQFFARLTVDLLGNLLLMTGIFGVLLWIDWHVGAALLLYTIFTLAVIYRLRDMAVSHFRASRQNAAELYSLLEERIAGTEDVRANGGVAYVLRRFFERSRVAWRADVKAHLAGTGFYSVMVLLLTLGNILGLGLGAYFFLQHAISIGTVYLIYRYTELLRTPVEQIGRRIEELQQAGAAIMRIHDLLAIQPRLTDTGQQTLPPTALCVEFDAVSFHYADQLASPAPSATTLPLATPALATQPSVLHNISFTLPAGKTLGLLGRTGSGKSTLTRLLFRFYDPVTGEVRLNDIPLAALPLTTLRARLGMVTQEVQLFHATVRDNLTLFKQGIADATILEIVHMLGLGSWYAALPAGLDSKLAPGGSGLSAGQAQLLAFVRVFLHNPGLIILDEASSRLDPATERLLEQAIDRLLAGRTAIIIAHRLATVQRADYIMILEDGQCVEFGARFALAQDPTSRFAELLRVGLEEALA